jgi:hypothetical protein
MNAGLSGFSVIGLTMVQAKATRYWAVNVSSVQGRYECYIVIEKDYMSIKELSYDFSQT